QPPASAGRPHGRRRPTHRPPPIPSSRRPANLPAAGSGRCSGPLSVTSPDFPADLQRNPVAGRGSPRDDDRVRTAGRGLGSTHRRRGGPLGGEPTPRALGHPPPSSPPRSGLVQHLGHRPRRLGDVNSRNHFPPPRSGAPPGSAGVSDTTDTHRTRLNPGPNWPRATNNRCFLAASSA